MKFVVSFLYVVLVLIAPASWAAKTYITLENVQVFDAPNGNMLEQWPDKTLFTANTVADNWLVISGHFPEGVWQPVDNKRFIQLSASLKLRTPYQHKSAKTIVYKALKKIGSNAKAYKLLEDTQVYLSKSETSQSALNKLSTTELNTNDLSANKSTIPEVAVTDPNTQEAVALGADSQLDTTDNHNPLWLKDTVFTSTFEDRQWIKVTGHFPTHAWEKLEQPVWIKKPVKLQNRTQPRRYERKKHSKRFAIIDKKRFELSVYEVVDGKKQKLMRTPVALGYDRCLSEAKGGKCYYTPEGEFEIEFKLFDPDGINWCIPPKMAAEFKSKLARGERCWRGVMGNYAMHFGDSLFLHGTSNPNSIGSRTTHGCVRLRNPDIEMVYQMLRNGDKVLISETPEDFDLLALAGYETEPESLEVKSEVQQPLAQKSSL